MSLNEVTIKAKARQTCESFNSNEINHLRRMQFLILKQREQLVKDYSEEYINNEIIRLENKIRRIQNEN